MPPYDELIYVANREKLADSRLKRFLQAVERAHALDLINHPGRSVEAVRSRPRPGTRRRAQPARLARHPAPLRAEPGRPRSRRYVRFAEFLKERELIASVPKLAEYAVELE